MSRAKAARSAVGCCGIATAPATATPPLDPAQLKHDGRVSRTAWRFPQAHAPLCSTGVSNPTSPTPTPRYLAAGAHPVDIRNALKGHPMADQMPEIIGPEPEPEQVGWWWWGARVDDVDMEGQPDWRSSTSLVPGGQRNSPLGSLGMFALRPALAGSGQVIALPHAGSSLTAPSALPLPAARCPGGRQG